MSVENLINYLLYIIPGFLAVSIFRAAYPVKKDSDFARLAWSLVYGIAIYAIAKRSTDYFGLDVRFDSGQMPGIQSLALLGALAVVAGYTRVSLHTLRFFVSKRFSALKFIQPKPASLWSSINSEEPVEWAVLTLKDGTRYLGYIGNWAYDPDATDQELLLTEAQRVDEAITPIYKISGRGVYLKTSSIDRIEFWSGEVPADATNSEAFADKVESANAVQ